MLITQRQSAVVLEQGGLARRQARDVLRAGFAGASTRAGNVCLYERARVEDLASWPVLPLSELDELCPSGVFVGRRAPDLSADRTAQLDSLSGGWQMSVWTWLWLRLRLKKYGPFPFVATVAGYVALGADITAAERPGADTTSLVLAEPGAWFEGVRRRRVQTGPGRAWVIREPPR